jgi:hypothetical protein
MKSTRSIIIVAGCHRPCQCVACTAYRYMNQGVGELVKGFISVPEKACGCGQPFWWQCSCEAVPA